MSIVPANYRSVDQFPLHTLPPDVGEYVGAQAQSIGCDPAMVALPMLGCLAQAIGNSSVIELKSGWAEPAIIWGAVVCESGSQKSPAFRASTRFMYWFEAAAAQRYRDRVAANEADEGEVQHRFITSDITIEALSPILAHQNDGILVVSDELSGWFAGQNQYKGGRGSDTSNWLSCWSREPIIVDRKTPVQKTLYVPHAAVSVIGTIQPATLQRYLRQHNIDNGLAARFLFAVPEQRVRRWSEVTVDPELALRVGALLNDLLELPDNQKVTLSPEAKERWIAFYNDLNREMAGLRGGIRAAYSKLEAYAARFALIFQLCHGGHVVSDATMEGAIILANWFAGQARKVYAMIEPADNDLAAALESIRSHGGRITARELRASGRKFRAAGRAEMILRQLVDLGEARPEIVATATNMRTEYVLVSDSPTSREISESDTDTADTVDPLTNGHVEIDAINRLFGEVDDLESLEEVVSLDRGSLRF